MTEPIRQVECMGEHRSRFDLLAAVCVETDMGQDWYALHVRSRFEKTVQMQLAQKGYNTFLPTYPSRRRWSDRAKVISLPVFPNYVFCRFDVEARLPILITPGVNALVGVGKVPLPLDETEITALQQLYHSQMTLQPWNYLNNGDVVRITKGPLQGLTGIVVRDGRQDRLVISVTLLKRSVAVDIDRNSIEVLHYCWNQQIPSARLVGSEATC
jgi:transcription antitermination factor NusG